MNNPANFIFAACQAGAEAALRKEIPENHPELKLAFSRPGFVTFKVDPNNRLPDRYSLKSTLARTSGWSLGRAESENSAEIVASILENGAEQLAAADVIHVWERDRKVPGSGGFEPGVSVLANEVGQQVLAAMEASGKFSNKPALNRLARPDSVVFDICVVEPNQWWYGFHEANTSAGRWPGGVPMFDTDVEPISRAYFKLKEALLWSGIPVSEGDVCAELGSAPGGACQLLLEMGALVIAIDPAELEADVLKHPNLNHIRRRGHEVKKRDFRDVRWLFADISMVPNYTLDTVSAIVSHDAVNIKGMALTLKLTNWELLDSVPAWIQRVKDLGFKYVRTRQLAFNRQEICLIAAKDKFVLRAGKKRVSQPPQLQS
ncbi:SAM-dependent methyltransferase [Mariniblastus fucicola]|uniref:Putative 23S rRNA ribose 2'-O-ribose methyltransferase n=1 Tax=Mariniblastus fucicola TaxID=980251 RepID=A0A5B9P8F9_9BACT|nr:SAM-dependent methyltransferase [Mariniblastus fucicola]QEG20906.1 putative 23S rRNA ribose 2'-O-ribose methyltransferase [Mariniblastus fucicola]